MDSEHIPPPSAAAARAAGILKHPTELLLQILGCFYDRRLPDLQQEEYQHLGQFYRDLMLSMQNLRLTCRRFANVAAEFLLPQVHVTLDQASLDRVDEISKHPTISRGVRIVCINLDYRPKMKFVDFLAAGSDRDDRLVDGVSAYQKGHEEQRRLLETGSFASGIAASLSRMLQFDTLVIDNQHDYSGPAGPHEPNVKSIGAPFTWHEIASDYEPGNLAPARLLCELPVAIHAAGRSLRRFMLRGFPV